MEGLSKWIEYMGTTKESCRNAKLCEWVWHNIWTIVQRDYEITTKERTIKVLRAK